MHIVEGAERRRGLLGCLPHETFVDLVPGEHLLRRGYPNPCAASGQQADSYMTAASLIVELDDGAGAPECEVALAPRELDERLPAANRR
jgi:hypothetical protein